MRDIFIGVLIGLVLGISIPFLFRKAPKLEVSQSLSVDKNEDDIPKKKELVLDIDKDTVRIESLYFSDYYGEIEIETEISRKDIERKHSLCIGLGIINKSIFFSTGYTYNRNEFKIHIGYEFTKKETLLGASYAYQFFKW